MKIIPDPPESYYHPFDNPSGEPAEPEILCDCGHWDFEEETVEVDGKVLCVNCSELKDRNPTPVSV